MGPPRHYSRKFTQTQPEIASLRHLHFADMGDGNSSGIPQRERMFRQAARQRSDGDAVSQGGFGSGLLLFQIC